MDERLPRIQDVAREAGVSTATVSRAISHPEKVALATREAVLRAVERTGYRVNQAARNLRSGRTAAIVVLVPNLGNPFFSEVLSGIEATASAGGYSVLIADTMHSKFRNPTLGEYLRSDRCDGVIVLDGTLSRDFVANEISENGAPPVVFACEWTSESHHPAVTIDNREGAAMAVRHLCALGHTAIGHLSGPVGNVLTDARLEGARQTLAEHGLPARPEWFLTGDFTLQSGADAARQWLAQRERPTAMFCASDRMAFGFISEIDRHGFRVPQDVSVIGFDDIDIARCFIPALTTIRQPRMEIGSLAASLLIERIANPQASEPAPVRHLAVELIIRKSCAPPPAAS